MRYRLRNGIEVTPVEERHGWVRVEVLPEGPFSDGHGHFVTGLVIGAELCFIPETEDGPSDPMTWDPGMFGPLFAMAEAVA